MLKTFYLLFWLSLQVWSRVYKNNEHNVINYSLSIQVVDYQWFQLAGIIIRIDYCNKSLIEHDIVTNDSGKVELTGKLAKQDQYSLNITATTQFNLITTTMNIKGLVNSSGTVIFDGILQFNQSDVKSDDVFLLGTIQLTTFSEKEIPLQFAQVDFTAIYQEGKQIKFTAVSDDQGVKVIRFYLPNLGTPLIIQYTASKFGFWNKQQLTNDLVLWPQNNYKMNIDIILDPGQFELILAVLITDEDQLPICEVELLVVCKDSQQKLNPISGLSEEDGNVKVRIPLKATPNIHLTLTLNKIKYKKFRKNIDLSFNLNVRENSFTHDLGIVKLQKMKEPPQTTQRISIQGTLFDEEKLTNDLIGLPLILNLKRCQPILITQMYTLSDDQNNYSFSIETFIGEQYQVILNVDGQPFFQVQNESFALTGPQDPQQITHNIILQRNLVNCNITGSIVDFQLKPIKNAQVLILTSFPLMSNTNFYNQSVTVQEGVFTLLFQCYNQVKTLLNMQMQNAEYPHELLTPQQFICGNRQIQFMPIVLSPKSVLITITGTIRDNSEVQIYVSNAQVLFSLTPQDPLTSSLETVTNKKGNYLLSFKAVKNQIYSVIVTVSNSDFDKSEQSFLMSADKDRTLIKNFYLNRIQIQITLNICLIDQNGKSLSLSQIKLQNITPKLQVNDTNECYLDSSGKCDVKISCYYNTKVEFYIELLAKSYRKVRTDKLVFICVGKTIDLPLVKVKLKSIYINLLIEGQLKGPKGNGQRAAKILIFTKPETTQFEVQTDIEGKWQLKINILKVNVRYDIIEQYENSYGLSYQNVQSFISHKDNLTINFPTDYYDDFLQYNLNGQLLTHEMFVVSDIQVTLQCNQTVDKDGNQINLQLNADLYGKFIFKWDMLVNFNSKIDCLILSNQTEKFKQTSIKFQATPSTQEISLNMIIELTDDFKGYIKANYQLVTIKGSVITQCFNKENKVVKEGLQGVEIQVKHWDGVKFVSIGYFSVSRQDGDYDLKMQILKKDLQILIQLIFTKPQFIPNDIELSLNQSQDGQRFVESQQVFMVSNEGTQACQNMQEGNQGNSDTNGEIIKYDKGNQSNKNHENHETSKLIYLLIGLLALMGVLALGLAIKLVFVLQQSEETISQIRNNVNEAPQNRENIFRIQNGN